MSKEVLLLQKVRNAQDAAARLPVTPESLSNDLLRLGLKRGSNLLVHYASTWMQQQRSNPESKTQERTP